MITISETPLHQKRKGDILAALTILLISSIGFAAGYIQSLKNNQLDTTEDIIQDFEDEVDESDNTLYRNKGSNRYKN